MDEKSVAETEQQEIKTEQQAVETEPQEAETEQAKTEQTEIEQEEAAPAKEKLKLFDWLKQSKARWISLAAAVVVLLAAAVVGVLWGTNNYKTPIKTIEKYANKESYTVEQELCDTLNGFMESDIRDILDILQNSEYVADAMESFPDEVVNDYNEHCDWYGDDFKITYTITDKTKLTKLEIRDYLDELQEAIDDFVAWTEDTEDFTSADWGDFADELDLTKSEAKALAEAVVKLGETYERIAITEGYDLTVTETITGERLNKSREREVTYTVLKVNGRWLTYTTSRYTLQAYMAHFLNVDVIAHYGENYELLWWDWLWG